MRKAFLERLYVRTSWWEDDGGADFVLKELLDENEVEGFVVNVLLTAAEILNAQENFVLILVL